MRSLTDRDAWCVIGAGPSGLAAVRHLRDAGIPVECLEREQGIGGNWLFGSGTSRVFASTRLISSQRLTEFADFPMPRHWPAYPDHRQCLEYLRSYATHFDLEPQIRTGVVVESIEPAGPYEPPVGLPGLLPASSSPVATTMCHGIQTCLVASAACSSMRPTTRAPRRRSLSPANECS